jgi:ABC-type multidrug transport system fused ATPase/permease subunit
VLLLGPVDTTLLAVVGLIALALLFDYTNGFHDSANSIATVIATRVLRPRWAVAWAAGWNFVAFFFERSGADRRAVLRMSGLLVAVRGGRVGLRSQGRVGPVELAVPGLGVVAALWLVGWDVATGATNPVLLAATALGVLGAFEAVAGLGGVWATSAGVRAAATRIQALAAERPAVTDPVWPRPRPARVDLRFEGVTLTYPRASGAALTDLDLQVRAGE